MSDIYFTVCRVKDCTLSSLFCQLSSRLTISSMQWDKVERIPAVVALKVMASPLKSIPFIPLGLAGENTGPHRIKEMTRVWWQPYDFIKNEHFSFSHWNPHPLLQRETTKIDFWTDAIETTAGLLTFLFAAIVVMIIFTISSCSGGKIIFILLHYWLKKQQQF